jgi:hypothetical protein
VERYRAEPADGLHHGRRTATTCCGRPRWSCPSFWPHSRTSRSPRPTPPGHVKSVFATEFDKGPVTVTITLQRDRDQIEGIFMEPAG